MSERYNLWRREIFLKRKRRELKNFDFTLISSNCNGGCVLHELGLMFNSPFVNLFIEAGDYIKILKNLKYYMSCELTFLEEGTGTPNYPYAGYPIGVLDDVYIYFMHYSSVDEAKEKWNARVKRINYDNLYVLMTDRSHCTYQLLKEFDSLPYHKVVFTHNQMPEIHSSFYISGFEKEDKVGILSDYCGKSWKKYYDQFDFIKWFNGELSRYL